MCLIKSRQECDPTYPGPAAFSEPETLAVAAALEQHRGQIQLFTSLHTFGSMVLYPWAYSGQNISNWQLHESLGRTFAAAIEQHSGHRYKVGNTGKLLTAAPGGSDDYAIYAGARTSFTIELPKGNVGDGYQAFELTESTLLSQVALFWVGFERMLNYVAENDMN